MVELAAVVLVLFLLMCGWVLNCLGFHKWDTSGELTDICRHCGKRRPKQ